MAILENHPLLDLFSETVASRSMSSEMRALRSDPISEWRTPQSDFSGMNNEVQAEIISIDTDHVNADGTVPFESVDFCIADTVSETVSYENSYSATPPVSRAVTRPVSSTDDSNEDVSDVVDNNEQRRAKRIDIDLLINKYIDGRPHLARAANISPDGLQLHRVFEPASNQKQIGVQFQLPGSDRVITCAARVVYKTSADDMFGLEFTHVAPEHRELIDAFVENNAAAAA